MTYFVFWGVKKNYIVIQKKYISDYQNYINKTENR